MNGFIEYDKKSICVETIDGKKAVRFVDLCKLSRKSNSCFYNVKDRKMSTLKNYLIKKPNRSLYITLEGCVKLLSLMYNPDDGLIAAVKRAIEPNVVHINGCETIKGEKSFSSQLFTEDGIEGKLDELNRMVRTIGVTLQNINGMLYEQMNKKEATEKPIFKDMLKEFLKEVLNG